MITYNHAYTIAFSVSGSIHPTGEDVTPEQLLKAIENRVADLRENDMSEVITCCDAPYDTYEEEPVITYEYRVYETIGDFDSMKAHYIRDGFNEQHEAAKDAESYLLDNYCIKVQSSDREEITILKLVRS